MTAQVGVIWFQVHLKGLPVHVAYAGTGANAIEAAIPLIAALHGLEDALERAGPPPRRLCRHMHHALNLNIGRIAGGDWTSSVPAWCVFDVRMGVFPGQDLGRGAGRDRGGPARCRRATATSCAIPGPRSSTTASRPRATRFGDDRGAAAAQAIGALEAAHRSVTGAALDRIPITATTDARFFGLYADTPALVYGPRAEAIHGFNERVELESLRRTTQSIALFIAGWCGLEPL